MTTPTKPERSAATSPRPAVRRIASDQPFHRAGTPLDLQVGDFFVWAYSDLLSNALRGVLAEFIVGSALDACTNYRQAWEPYDLMTASGITVEVKSAAYLQSWAQKQPSRISFSIAPALAWNASTGAYDSERRRHADVYVFALLAEQDITRVDPLDVSQWKLFVLPTHRLDERLPTQKTISLATLKSLESIHATFEALPAAVARAHSTNTRRAVP